MNATTMMVPQTDPGAGYLSARSEIDAAVQQVLASGWYILGAETQGFEREFAAWLGIGHAVGCGNGTDALALALRALDIGPGCTVATVSHSAVATVAAIEQAGAAPLLLDIEADHYTMDAAELAAVLDHPPPGLAPIRAVIPVHLYGQAADMAPILAACARHGVAVIEDASQAHGATYHGRRVGTLGRIGAFSLYPTKNLAALGDAGVLATAEPALAERLTALRQYGWRQRHVAGEAGVNSRLDEMQAAILRVRLRHLDARNARRNVVAMAYDVALQGTGASPPAARAGCVHVFHQYVVRVGGRDAVAARLRLAGIGTAVHYPLPIHLQPAYAGRVALGPGGCRVTERVVPEILSLPMFPELSDAQVDHVCQALRTL